MEYQHMKFSDSEEKVRAWVWLAKFDGKEFICPKCAHQQFYQHKKNQEIRECKNCDLEVMRSLMWAYLAMEKRLSFQLRQKVCTK